MDKKLIKIVCFAGLRKYFGSETSVFVEDGASYSGVIDALKALNPEATEVLPSCRIAVNEAFVALNEPIKNENTIFLIPPSSGG
ncbi:MAG: MoaD/ThiS family protein [Prolixibacteraceae bacterium]|nr:MoaD/ThiS family protein [Prolixibacteraceae bacterium]